jgi:hypothetical protein
MRPITIDLDPADASLTGFASNVTGASFTLTTTATSDGLAHQVSIKNDSATNHSGKTVTLVGTDADGKAQTEVVTAPTGNATVESSKYFKTLTSATPSATIGADTFDIGWVDEVASQTIILESTAETPATVQVNVTGTVNYTIQATLDDPFDPAIMTDQDALAWINDGNFTTKTADALAYLSAAGVQAIRLIFNSYSSGAEAQMYIRSNAS